MSPNTSIHKVISEEVEGIQVNIEIQSERVLVRIEVAGSSQNYNFSRMEFINLHGTISLGMELMKENNNPKPTTILDEHASDKEMKAARSGSLIDYDEVLRRAEVQDGW